MTGRDQVFSSATSDLVDFAFDATVAEVFPDMIRRSVPGYETVVPLSALVASRHLRNGDKCYDLGCSLGATSLALVGLLGDLEVEILAIDSSAAMLQRAAGAISDARVQWLEQDIRETKIEDAGAVIMNYTLQFVPPRDRLDLLRRIHAGMRSHGVLLVSEKIASDQYDVDTHLDFKRANGYSELEISQKRAALEDVMVPEDIDLHIDRLKRAGFTEIRTWFRCFNWASFIALP